MVDLDEAVHCRHEVFRSERPSGGEHAIVKVLHADASQLPKNVKGIEYFLQVHECDVPGTPLFLADFLKRGSSAPVPAAGIEKDEVELFHP
jgi:hypothetical protein